MIVIVEHVCILIGLLSFPLNIICILMFDENKLKKWL